MQRHTEKIKYVKKTGKRVHSYFMDFCDNTSIGGFKFLGETRTWAEKLFWVLAISLSLYACIHLIYQTYVKWMSSPVIVSFATSLTPINEVPFPAVTICTDIKSRKNHFNYGAVEEKIANKTATDDELRKYNYMNMVCDKSFSSVQVEESYDSNVEAINFITHVAPKVHEVIESIKWRGQMYKNVSNFFTPVLTSEGVCYTFNILDRKDLFRKEVLPYKDFYYNGNVSSWTVGRGYSKHDKGRYPRYTVVSGTAGGIDIILTLKEEDIDYSCTPDFVGHKISLLNPAQIPRGRLNYFAVPMNQIVLANVKPIIQKTSKELANYLPQIRNCFYSRERSLISYKTYNQPNCLFECLANYTLGKCGCVGFNMPRTNSTPLCSYSSRSCMDNAKALYLLPENNYSNVSYSDQCLCLPTCSSLDFEVELSQAEWIWRHLQEMKTLESVGAHKSRLRIFFKYMQFTTSVRDELYATIDFLSNCGGILGLFIGFSTISLFEVIYFLTLRLMCKIWTHKKDKKQRQELQQISEVPEGALENEEIEEERENP